MPFSIERELHKSRTRDVVDGRLEELGSYLKSNYGRSVRDDSRLSYMWANGETNMSMERVAQEVNEMHRLYEDTDYGHVSRQVVDRVKECICNEYGLDDATATILSVRYMIPATKFMYELDTKRC